MARLGTNDMDSGKTATGNFAFSGIRTDRLGASEYTLATTAVDETGSTVDFRDLLVAMMKTSVAGCKGNARSGNILMRAVSFGSQHRDSGGVNEFHGFLPLDQIDTALYDKLDPSGLTPLYDVTYSVVAATNAYGKRLRDDDYAVNGIVFIITDGYDNVSKLTPSAVRAELELATRGEILESMISILIGVNAKEHEAKLMKFKADAGIDHYVDIADATPESLAKLAQFISQSVSSQSQAMGTGGPSQNINPTF